MTKTISVRIDSQTKKRLKLLTKRAQRSQSALAAEAIAAFTESECWQQDEIRAGLKELDAGEGVSHPAASAWLRSWGRPGEGKPPG